MQKILIANRKTNKNIRIYEGIKLKIKLQQHINKWEKCDQEKKMLIIRNK